MVKIKLIINRFDIITTISSVNNKKKTANKGRGIFLILKLLTLLLERKRFYVRTEVA